jgi:hypothetical protein
MANETTADVRRLLVVIGGDDDGLPAQLLAAHALASHLEAEEARYVAAVGDPQWVSQRTHFGIGRALAVLQARRLASACCRLLRCVRSPPSLQLKCRPPVFFLSTL